MEPMTDAFLTASVLAAVATRPAFPERRVEGTTRIIGIANERVKNAIGSRQWLTNLHVWCLIIGEITKFGVKTTELDDGLEVHGQDESTLKDGVRVHCYDDHRVTMAFSVLATRIKGTWWDDLHNKIGISVEGVDLEKASGSGSQATHDPAASLFIIGMRGAGKSHIARLSGETLDWEIVDADSVFAQKVGNIKEFVKEKGWEAFRLAEA
ncbi:hypothetical protein M422DRAFT_27676 [Sphaerobolus stellatus SS14]|nr:hypothetical protein M422DRAFT_27676 [Sphaerobolus stellatus SS14]